MKETAGHPGTGDWLARRAGSLLLWLRPALLVLLAASLVRARTLRTEPAGDREAGLAGDAAAFGPVWFLDCGFPRQCRIVTDDGEWIVVTDASGNRLLEFALEAPSLVADPPYRALPREGAIPVEGTVLRGAPPLPAGFPYPATPTPTAPPGSGPTATPTPGSPGTPTPDTTPTKTRY